MVDVNIRSVETLNTEPLTSDLIPIIRSDSTILSQRYTRFKDFLQPPAGRLLPAAAPTGLTTAMLSFVTGNPCVDRSSDWGRGWY